ncbi:MAG: methyltransferase domain-containing protein [Ignavibacteriales bacterium]|nr:MAG: methyltransferase domain-containing protein [Ignavibacteriales bacterium]
MPSETETLKKTLSSSYLHDKWIDTYIDDSKVLYDLVFDDLKKIVWEQESNKALDAGCGNGVNSLRLLNRDFNVTACDFSESALAHCKVFLEKHLKENNCQLFREDLLSLSFRDNEFDVVVCWGVLMHIYEIERALGELCRVTKKGGYVIICEVSLTAFDSLVIKVLKNIFKRSERGLKSKFGIDYWSETPAGKIIVRKTNIKILVDFMSVNGFDLVKKIPGQFSQFYTKFTSKLFRNTILKFNLFWFKHLKFTSPSVEQVLVFKKNDRNIHRV